MIKRCKFIVALVLCLCVFAYDTVNIFGDWGGRSIAWATDPTFSSNALVLSGQLGLYFYLKDFDTNTAGTMSFKIGDTEIDSVSFTQDTKVEKGEDVETQTENDSNIKLYGFRCDVNAIQMADKITAEYTYGTNSTVKNDGTDAINSVKAYLDALNPAANSKLADLVNAIRDYGHFAQLTLKDTNSKYGTHTSMDKGSTSDLDTNVSEWTTESNPKIKIYTGDTITGDSATDAGDNIYKGVSFTLDLDSETALRVYLPKESSLRSAITNITATAATDNDNAYKINANNVTTPDSDSEFQIVFSNISAHQLGDIFTIPVTISNTSYTIVISPMSYVYAVTALSYSTDEEKTNLQNNMGIDSETELKHFKQAVVALYNYYKATIAYRTSTEYNAQ